MQPNRLGNCGWYFRVLNCASEKGLSFEVCGLLCDLVTPRSASRKAVAFLHGAAAVGVRRQLTGWNAMLGERLVEQGLEQGGVFHVGDAPADDAAAEDVEDDIQVEI